jgi:hypothetical protein
MRKKVYGSDVSGEQFDLVRPLLEGVRRGTKPRTVNDVKVVQELMRHSKISTTMEVYTQAGMTKKRAAQRKAVDALFNRDSEASRRGKLRGKLIAPLSLPRNP